MGAERREQPTMVDAVLPAGGRISGAFAAEAGAEVKALIPLHGRTVLERTLTTLRATPRVHRLVVIGPEEVQAHPAAQAADAVLPETETGPGNILRGFEWLREAHGGTLPERALVLTTDLPFLTPAVLERFLDACPPDLDLCVPLVRREELLARFPEHQALFVRLRDGVWTIGCAFLVNPAALLANRAHLEHVFAARKSQLRMVRLLGASFVLRFLTGRIGVPDVAQRCLDMLGCTGAGLPGCPPELAFDIDQPGEYRYAREHVGK